jgi:alpha-mannosidase
VQAYRSPLGRRLVVRGRIGELLCYTQTLTLWRGVDRVDCATTIDDFVGEDRLLRLRWPCPVPGAMPVSEVGDAVVGRGFALLHHPHTDSESVDTAEQPWTLDNPAYGWFGLSSAARIRVGDDVRAVSVAEVVTPSEASSGELARDLVVALVRAGVTATCSSADRPRYGLLGVDSNLPDARIALGQNAFTESVLAAADAAYAREVKRQLADTGRAVVWVPAAGTLADAWIPDADLRDASALPVLVIAGRDDAHLAAAIASVVDDLADAEIVVEQHAPSGLPDFESRTVALCNRGVPSFAVETDGTLHTALMRSCTGWPSGIWIDEPRRTAPGGSNFQLQHWTHTFDYALVCGGGDWRHADIPERSTEFSHPLLPVAASDSLSGLPTTGSLLEVGPAGAVQLGALKAAGNPLAHGSGLRVDPGHVAIRLVETRGGQTDVAVRSGLGTVSELRAADLLEQPRGQHHLTTLHGHQVGTALARLDLPRLLDAENTTLAPDAEVAQPLYARYWLHNRGPAPLGGLPAVAHLHPHQLTAEAGSEVTLRLTLASDSIDASQDGTVALVCPPGWSARPAALPFTLPAGEHLEADVAIKTPAGVEPGVYPVRAQLQVANAAVPASWRQVVEDVALVSVGGADDSGLIYLVREPTDVVVAAGDSARLAVTIGSRAGADLSLEAHLISPWGTWEWTGPATLGAVLPGQGTVEVGFDVSPPAWVEPGQWWALIRVGCAGRLLYSPAVKVTVR